MKNNKAVPSKLASWVGPAALLAAAAGTAALGLWQMQGGYGPLALAIGLLALSAALGGVWLYRIRTRYLFAVWDAYAEKELARTEHLVHSASTVRKRVLSAEPNRL